MPMKTGRQICALSEREDVMEFLRVYENPIVTIKYKACINVIEAYSVYVQA